MSAAAAGAKKRLSVGAIAGGGFALGCGCRDAKAVAVAAAASTSPYSAAGTETTTSTATTATWRRARTPPHRPSSSASGSTGTLTVPSASSSSSFPWDRADAEGDGDTGDEVDCKGEASTTTSFSGLLRQLNELEQSVVSWGRKSASKDHLSPPPRPLPALPVKQRLAHSCDGDRKEGHGNFSPPPPPPPPPPFQFQITQQRQKAKSMDKADRQVEVAHSKSKQPQPQPPPPPPPPPLPLPLPPERQFKAQSTDDDKGGKKEDASMFPTPPQAPYHLKSKSSVLDGNVGVAVVKQSDDPLGDFRRSMVNMIVENRIVTGEELRELLRHFLALNAPRHHEAILAAFTEIWDEAFSAKTAHGRREPVAARTTTAMATPPRPRPTPPRRRHAPPTRSWR